jgi:hypothetical protein
MKRSNLAFWVPAVALGVCATAAADPSAAPPMAAQQRQTNNESADGGICRTTEYGEYRCRSFVAQANLDADGQYASTRVGVSQMRNTATIYGYRSLECTVADRSILAVSPNRATVRALLDADSASCTTYGSVYNSETGESENWVFTGLVTLEADLRNPVRQWTWAYPRAYQNHATGESTRDNCVGGVSADPVEGGMLIAGIYFPFGPDDVEGSFFYERCTTIAK